MQFVDFQNLKPEQKEFYSFEQLSKIDALIERMDNLGTKYANKWVERAMTGFIVLILLGFFGTIFALIGWHETQNTLAQTNESH